MTWEFLSDIIKNKVERYKKEQGFITVNQLNTQIESEFTALKNNEYFHDDFDATDEQTQEAWLANIKLRLKSVIVTTIDPDNIIDESEHYQRWIDKRNPAIRWNYFDRYLHYLRKLGRPVDVIQNTEKSTLAIIERLGDPRRYDIDQLQKGLVLGSVQSGKTANFNGVISRAIDAGYDMIIVFSGIMEDLRYQTQRRINHDVIGLGEIGYQINQPVGVGKDQKFGSDGTYQITSITSTQADFKKSMVDGNFDFSNQRILVCKKNVSVLTNLIFWLKSSLPPGSDKLNKSLLVIDDEADNASLNNLGYKGAEYASKVNGNIRALLNLFGRRSYLGYTATPFANILQDQHGEGKENAWPIKYRYQGQQHEIKCSLSPGLFPDKFIYKLASPSTYLGPRRFFSTGREQEGDHKIPLIETIPEPEDDADLTIGDEDILLQRSLTDAIDCFVLSIALRDSRKSVLEVLPGYTPHNTMLVHISRLIADQNAAAKRIKKYVSHLTKKISDDGISDPDGIYEKLRLQWNRFFAYKVTNIRSFLPEDYNADGLINRTWNDISELLPNAVRDITVKAINSSTGDKLIYPETEAKKYIAVGGNRLSRGFTLEGLTINYFLRDTNYYDALLQMGRWFGYRPGYIDACRLFIDAGTEDKYNFITAALCELEELIESMEIQKKSPKEFELRIRKHPDVLKITREAILKNANEVRYSFQDVVHQSVEFKLEKNNLESAWSGLKALFSDKSFAGKGDKSFYTFDGTSKDLYQFLDLPSTFTKSFLKKDMMQYISMCNERGILTSWRIAIKKTGSGRSLSDDVIKNISLIVRSAPKEEEGQHYKDLKNEMLFIASGKSRNIMTSGSDEAVGLSPEIIDKAKKEFRAERKKKLTEDNNKTEVEAQKIVDKTTIPGWIFRKVRPQTQGLLLIYLIDLQEVFKSEELKAAAKANDINIDIPLIGYALSFPQIMDDPGAIYLANEYTQQEEPEGQNEDDETPEDFNTEVNDIG